MVEQRLAPILIPKSGKTEWVCRARWKILQDDVMFLYHIDITLIDMCSDRFFIGRRHGRAIVAVFTRNRPSLT